MSRSLITECDTDELLLDSSIDNEDDLSPLRTSTFEKIRQEVKAHTSFAPTYLHHSSNHLPTRQQQLHNPAHSAPLHRGSEDYGSSFDVGNAYPYQSHNENTASSYEELKPRWSPSKAKATQSHNDMTDNDTDTDFHFETERIANQLKQVQRMRRAKLATMNRSLQTDMPTEIPAGSAINRRHPSSSTLPEYITYDNTVNREVERGRGAKLHQINTKSHLRSGTRTTTDRSSYGGDFSARDQEDNDNDSAMNSGSGTVIRSPFTGTAGRKSRRYRYASLMI
jgi:hypothetical protein